MTDSRMTGQSLSRIIIGRSSAIQRLREQIVMIAAHRGPVLIQGPTGSGKELVAEALHLASGRMGNLVSVNVCAIAESMFEAALFGHVKGAFTGATSSTRGYFAEADRGTLFLDEISGLPLVMQPKLLRAIETKQYRAVGAGSDARSDFRLVAASNQNLHALERDGRFRTDLAHRLRGFTLTLPSLRERIEDVHLLARYFASETEAPELPVLTSGAISVLERHTWPGNVRELRNLIDAAACLARDGIIDGSLVRELLASHVAVSSAATSPAHDLRRARLVRALEQADGDVTRAAAILGCHRATVYREMKRTGVRVADRRASQLERVEARPAPVA